MTYDYADTFTLGNKGIISLKAFLCVNFPKKSMFAHEGESYERWLKDLNDTHENEPIHFTGTTPEERFRNTLRGKLNEVFAAERASPEDVEASLKGLIHENGLQIVSARVADIKPVYEP